MPFGVIINPDYVPLAPPPPVPPPPPPAPVGLFEPGGTYFNPAPAPTPPPPPPPPPVGLFEPGGTYFNPAPLPPPLPPVGEFEPGGNYFNPPPLPPPSTADDGSVGLFEPGGTYFNPPPLPLPVGPPIGEGEQLPEWTLDDPFALGFFSADNPVLRGGDWLAALVDECVPYRLEAKAVAADAMGEGLAGGIGDGGLAYGPFQDHLTEFPGRPFYGRGKNNDIVNAWAWTRNGLRYSLRQMATSSHSAMHLTGAAAVSAIVRGYEKPADIPGAISLRTGYYKILQTQGDQWVAYIAAKALGPTKGGKQLIAPDTSPSTGPLAFPKPTKQWKATMHFLASDVPAAGADARKAGARARAAVRSTLWRAPTG